jgi:hypothetical protein
LFLDFSHLHVERGYDGLHKPRGKLTAIRRGDAVQRASVYQRAVDRVYKLDA